MAPPDAATSIRYRPLDRSGNEIRLLELQPATTNDINERVGITDPREVPSYKAISDFLNRPYFRNSWILDDMSKARFPAFLLGDDIVSWMQVLRLNRVNEDIKDHGADMFPDELRPLLEYMPLGSVYAFLKEFDNRQRQEGGTPAMLTTTTSSVRSSSSISNMRTKSRQ
ncbi:hypothetical protein M440DRAFT_1388144 [Trichoderma longibrachiatum ATCC 18648]|uniref:Uncharacterized protein n=1 Tax=Trichoderma longibrachiatum ATCC 18648 TaxID=983965 RepID=A0A2T4CJQ5_TRILO|nr:hypothetical protein M440DRAFT_1388144 [Trichoderma longibrachiatum ATCC 18648]